MPAASPPADERERLATLESYAIMDTPTDQSFERLVHLAAEYFNVPIALVSLVDAERQWFKAAVGLDATETPREQAFCAHAILEPDRVLVVEDAERDPRFADNPMVIGGPSIRFYAGAPIRAENGQPLGTICIIDRHTRQLTDAERRFLENLAGNAGSMMELHRKNLALSTESRCDPLTGLANRRGFNLALAAACAARPDDMSFGLLALDLDRFKSINDELGHEVGDRVLTEVAVRLNRVVRGKDLVARLGGDEFTILAAGPIEQSGVTALAQRIMNAFIPDLIYDDVAIPIRTSIGIAVAPMHGDDPRTLSRAADLALYASKRGGRHAFTVAEPPDPNGRQLTLLPHDLLREAITNDGLSLLWQPYARPASPEPVGYVASPHWSPLGKEAMEPADLTALAEKCGLIAHLDALVLRKACSEAVSWPDQLPISVTLSASWFEEGNLIQSVTDALTSSGLAPDRLTIQLSAECQVFQRAGRDYVDDLRATGIATALIDFGGLSAALAPISDFKFDTVTLSRRLIHGIGGNQRDEAVIVAVIGLAHALQMQVSADGVETLAQQNVLLRAGCDFVQGPMIGPPGPQTERATEPREPAMITSSDTVQCDPGAGPATTNSIEAFAASAA